MQIIAARPIHGRAAFTTLGGVMNLDFNARPA
jgi:hypothetical protein